jgi:hypothetical protein
LHWRYQGDGLDFLGFKLARFDIGVKLRLGDGAFFNGVSDIPARTIGLEEKFEDAISRVDARGIIAKQFSAPIGATAAGNGAPFDRHLRSRLNHFNAAVYDKRFSRGIAHLFSDHAGGLAQ